MKNIITKLMAAEKWGHHHTALVFMALFLFGFMAFWQLLVPQLDTHAASLDCDTASNINVSTGECHALVDFYQSTNGALRTTGTDRGNDSDICSRYGINCGIDGSGNMYISNIDLSGNNLSGTIPDSIGNLVSLVGLTLNDNNLYGAIPTTLRNIDQLQSIMLNRNNISGILGTDFSLATNLKNIFVSNNVDLIVDFDYFNTLGTGVRALDIGNTILQGDPSILGSFTDLDTLFIDGRNGSTDFSNIRSVLIHLNNLTRLKLKSLNLAGELPDIRANFPNLRELSLEFNDFIGPLPESFESLTGLTSLVLSFNNFDGPIPTYLQTFPVGNDADIGTNCFETDIEDEGFISFLDEHFQGRTSQYNCRANMEVHSSVGTGLAPGTCTIYTLTYNNLGPQIANSLKIGQTFDPQVIVGSSNPPYTTGTVGATYGTLDDPCYYDATVNATGPYYAALENIVQTNYGATSLRALATSGLGFTGLQGTTEFAYTMDNACPWLFGTEDKALCFLMFGQDMSDVDPSCGYGGDEGYIRNLGNLPNEGSGEINVNICLPIDATGSISFISRITTLSINENGSGSDQTFNVTIESETTPIPTQSGTVVTGTQTNIVGTGSAGASVTITIGDTEFTGTVGEDGYFDIEVILEEGTNEITISIDDGESITEQTITIIVQIPPVSTPPSGGNGGGGGSTIITTDEEAGICEVRDCSDSYYDGICGVCDQQHNSADTSGKFLIDDALAFMQEVGNIMGSMTCTISQELVESYVFAYDIGITSVGNVCEADMYGPLIRKHLAKFLSMFAIRVLDMHPDTTRVCAFTDMAGESFEMQGFARISCQLGIMGLQQNGDPDTVFNPNQKVNRAMFGTAFSRLLYGGANNIAKDSILPRYERHLKALKKAGIMTDISNPMMDEVRGYVMLMMQRAYMQK